MVVFLITGKDWIKQMVLGTFLIPGFTCTTAFFINFIAMYYHASRAIPLSSMVSDNCTVHSPLPLNSIHPVSPQYATIKCNQSCTVSCSYSDVFR